MRPTGEDQRTEIYDRSTIPDKLNVEDGYGQETNELTDKYQKVLYRLFADFELNYRGVEEE